MVSSLRQAGFRVRSAFNSKRVIGISVLLILLYLTVLPIISVVISSFTAEGFELLGSAPALDNYRKLTDQPEIIYNTIIYTAGSALLTTLLATFLAWSIGRTNAPFRRLYYYIIFISFFLPPIIWEQTWLRLFGQAGLYAALLGVQSLPIRTLPGMIIVQSVRMAALGMVILIPLFASIDNSLEESGRISGATIFKTTTRITIPLIAPGIITVALLVSIITLGTVRVPLVLGVPAGIDVLATAIYEAARQVPTDYGIAMAEGVLLIVLALPLLYLYRKYIGKADRFQTVSGQGFQSTPLDIGKWRYAISLLTGLYLLVTILIPAFLMVYASFLPVYTSPLTVALSDFSFQAYSEVFALSTTWLSLRNSVIVAFSATTITIFGGVAIAWITNKSDIDFQRPIEYSAFIPIAVPSTALALGISFLYLRVVPIDLYGTLAIIVIAFLVRTLPISVRMIEPSVIQIGDSILEMAQVVGASRVRRLYSVVLPIIVSSIAGLWSMFFAFLLLELPIVILLYTARTKMVSVHLYTLFLDGEMTQGAALGVILIGGLLLTTLLAHKVGDLAGG